MEVITGILLTFTTSYLHKGSEVISGVYRNNLQIIIKLKGVHIFCALNGIFCSFVYYVLHSNSSLLLQIFKMEVNRYMLALYTPFAIKIILNASLFTSTKGELKSEVNLSLLLKKLNRIFEKRINDDFDLSKSKILDMCETNFHNMSIDNMDDIFTQIIPTKTLVCEKKKYKTEFKKKKGKRDKLEYILMTFGQRRLNLFIEKAKKNKG